MFSISIRPTVMAFIVLSFVEPFVFGPVLTSLKDGERAQILYLYDIRVPATSSSMDSRTLCQDCICVLSRPMALGVLPMYGTGHMLYLTRAHCT